MRGWSWTAGTGRLKYDFRKARLDGGRGIVLEPLELMERLAALVPPPRSHLARYHGVLGPSQYWREGVVPRPPAEEGCPGDREFDPADEEDGRPGRRRRKPKGKSPTWAERILRSLKLDVLLCPKCGGRMRVISTITEPWTVRRILRSMGLSTEILARAPPRESPQGEFGFDQ